MYVARHRMSGNPLIAPDSAELRLDLRFDDVGGGFVHCACVGLEIRGQDGEEGHWWVGGAFGDGVGVGEFFLHEGL